MIDKIKDIFNPPRHVIAEKGTFEWALIQMKKGKKIRRKTWTVDGFCISDHPLVGVNSVRVVDLLENDWEIV